MSFNSKLVSVGRRSSGNEQSFTLFTIVPSPSLFTRARVVHLTVNTGCIVQAPMSDTEVSNCTKPETCVNVGLLDSLAEVKDLHKMGLVS